MEISSVVSEKFISSLYGCNGAIDLQMLQFV